MHIRDVLDQLDAIHCGEAIHARLACIGGNDEHWQIYVRRTDGQPDYTMLTSTGVLEQHPDSPRNDLVGSDMLVDCDDE